MITNPVNSKSTQNILKGIDIFQHINNIDAIVFGDSELEVSKEDETKLKELGWEVEDNYSYRWAYFI